MFSGVGGGRGTDKIDLPHLPQAVTTPWNKTSSPGSWPGSSGPCHFWEVGVITPISLGV